MFHPATIFGSEGQRKIDLATELSAVLAFSAIKNNDKVGLLLFTDRVEKVIHPRKGRTHVLRLIRELYSFKPSGLQNRCQPGPELCKQTPQPSIHPDIGQ